MPESYFNSSDRCVQLPDFSFFSDRKAMDHFRDLDRLVDGASEMKFIVVGGSKFITDRPNLKSTAKVILPDPTSPSLSFYAEGVYDGGPKGLFAKIMRTTEYLVERNIQVRWYPHMICHAVTIADPGLASGWAQYESVLPYVKMSLRPCVVISNKTYGSLINAMNETFDRMFENSRLPQLRSRQQPEWIHLIDDEVLRNVLKEVYAAANHDLRVLAAIGVRTAFDRTSAILGIDESLDFASKLDRLVTDGKISQSDIAVLKVLIDAGGAAAHRGWLPASEHLTVMIPIIEALVQKEFVLQKELGSLKDSIPPRPSKPR
jgi:hypothetical protein